MNKKYVEQTLVSKLVQYAEAVRRTKDMPEGEVLARAKGVKEFFIDLYSKFSSEEAFKAVGECKHCYGKGYSSVLAPAHIAKPDFAGDKEQVIKPSRLEYRFCSCERGKALKHLILSNAAWIVD